MATKSRSQTSTKSTDTDRNRLEDYFQLVEAAYAARLINWEGNGDEVKVTFTLPKSTSQIKGSSSAVSSRVREAYALAVSMKV